MNDSPVEPYICDVCGRHTAARGDVVLRHSDYRLLPMRVYLCPQSEQPRGGGGAA